MGPIPQHVAVILDGNRRWGIEHGLSPRDGHIQGWVATRNVASFCSALGVREVTFFVFSLENFNRRQEEVDWLMDLFDEGLDEFLAEPLTGRINFIGERTMLRESIQRKMSQIEEVSKDRRQFIMNLAMVYTCRLDITKSIKKVLTSDGQETKDITVDLLDANMMLPFKSIDMLLRTAGETRLSDFMMWEVSCSVVLIK